jgi:flagellar hook-associated protein 1 FlgK
MSTASWALATSQTQIGVVGNNIANINNPDFNQQTATITSNPVQNLGRYSVGTGVGVSGVTRNFDNFLFSQSLEANTNTSLWNTKSQLMSQVNAVLNDSSGTGLGNAINNFFQSWQTLTTNPGGATERGAVVSTANTLSGQISNAAKQMVAMQNNANSNISGAIPQINNYTSQIAGLNKLIHESEYNGNKANDYRDQREALIKKLSGLAGISYFEQSNGEDVVMLKNGSPLVAGQSNFTLSTALSTSNPRVNSIFWNSPNGGQVDITNQLSGGQLGAWVQTRDGDVQTVLNNLNSLSGSIVSQVNNLHQTGYGLDGSTGLNFFNPLAPGGSGALTNTGNGTVTGKLLNPVNLDTDHYNMSFDGTNYSIANMDKGGAVALSGATLAQAQNFFQQRGYSITINGIVKASDSFNVSAVNDAALLMSVNSTVQNDINKVAAGTTTQSGDSSMAQQMGAIQNQKVMGGSWNSAGSTGSSGIYTINDYYGSMIGAIGTSSKSANDNLVLNQGVGTQVNNMLQRVSGVNLDEQMIDLVKFQNSYQAAAKTLTTVDQMLQILMSIA